MKLNITPNKLKAVIKELKCIGAGGEPQDSGVGICRNIETSCNIRLADIYGYNSILKSWRHYSGDKNYPVPGDLWSYNTRPKYTGKYGVLRRQLARYLAREFTKLLKSSHTGIGCERDTDGDGNCDRHPNGCPRQAS